MIIADQEATHGKALNKAPIPKCSTRTDKKQLITIASASPIAIDYYR